MRIAHIVGNRPQFIKLALLHRALEKKAPGCNLIIHTGQHFDDNMSAVFFDELSIPSPDYQLQINGLPHGAMIGKMMMELEDILASEKPDAVVVYGDTNTTLAGALAAKKSNILLAHVEAGIRTGNETMPEESNRYLSDRMADLNFACTRLGLENLQGEGFGKQAGTIPSRIFNTGDLMYDAALLYSRQNAPGKRGKAGKEAAGSGPALKPLVLFHEQFPDRQDFILATIHRAENTENPENLRNIITALNRLHESIPVVFPLHPKTRQVLESQAIELRCISVPPQGYIDMLGLLNACTAVLTDSGGLSREAFFFSKPTLILMQQVFWPEILEYGNCLQADPLTEEILRGVRILLEGDKAFEPGIFGDGHAAEKIAEIILETAGRASGISKR